MQGCQTPVSFSGAHCLTSKHSSHTSRGSDCTMALEYCRSRQLHRICWDAFVTGLCTGKHQRPIYQFSLSLSEKGSFPRRSTVPTSYIQIPKGIPSHSFLKSAGIPRTASLPFLSCIELYILPFLEWSGAPILLEEQSLILTALSFSNPRQYRKAAEMAACPVATWLLCWGLLEVPPQIQSLSNHPRGTPLQLQSPCNPLRQPSSLGVPGLLKRIGTPKKGVLKRRKG